MGTEDPKAYLPYVKAVGADSKTFVAKMGQPKYQQLAEADFRRAKALAAEGFPMLILERNGKRTVITHGFAPYAQVKAALEKALK